MPWASRSTAAASLTCRASISSAAMAVEDEIVVPVRRRRRCACSPTTSPPGTGSPTAKVRHVNPSHVCPRRGSAESGHTGGHAMILRRL
jgi:hypothetical protein